MRHRCEAHPARGTCVAVGGADRRGLVTYVVDVDALVHDEVVDQAQVAVAHEREYVLDTGGGKRLSHRLCKVHCGCSRSLMRLQEGQHDVEQRLDPVDVGCVLAVQLLDTAARQACGDV